MRLLGSSQASINDTESPSVENEVPARNHGLATGHNNNGDTVERSSRRPAESRSGHRGDHAKATDLPHLLPVDEVAAVLAVSSRTVRRLIKRGAFVTYRVNRQLRVDASSVTHFLESSRVEPSRGTYPCQSGSTRSAKRISCDVAEETNFGPGGSKATKSRSGLPTARRPSGTLTNSRRTPEPPRLPKNAAELERELRRLSRCS